MDKPPEIRASESPEEGPREAAFYCGAQSALGPRALIWSRRTKARWIFPSGQPRRPADGDARCRLHPIADRDRTRSGRAVASSRGSRRSRCRRRRWRGARRSGPSALRSTRRDEPPCRRSRDRQRNLFPPIASCLQTRSDDRARGQRTDRRPPVATAMDRCGFER